MLKASRTLWGFGRVYTSKSSSISELRFNSIESIEIVGKWLLATSHNESKCAKLRQELCILQELRRRQEVRI